MAAGKDTPQDLVNAINATTAGVKAQLVNTGDGSANPYQIILSGAVGASGAFTMTPNYGSGSGSPGLSFGSNVANQTAVDASVKIDGVSYEIDLSAKNAKKLREELKHWIDAGRRVGGRRRGRPGDGVLAR